MLYPSCCYPPTTAGPRPNPAPIPNPKLWAPSFCYCCCTANADATAANCAFGRAKEAGPCRRLLPTWLPTCAAPRLPPSNPAMAEPIYCWEGCYGRLAKYDAMGIPLSGCG